MIAHGKGVLHVRARMLAGGMEFYGRTAFDIFG